MPLEYQNFKLEKEFEAIKNAVVEKVKPGKVTLRGVIGYAKVANKEYELYGFDLVSPSEHEVRILKYGRN